MALQFRFSEKGYETPTEESHPPFIRTEPPTPTTAYPTPNQAPTPNTVPTPNHAPSPSPSPGPNSVPTPASAPARPASRRPPLLQLPSYYLRRASGNGEKDVVPSLDDMLHKGVRRPRGGKVGLKDRIACYQWTFFTMTMATGGIANVLHSIPYEAAWIEGIGVAFALLNIVIFVTNCVLITARFRMRPGSFTESFTDQVESLFIPSFFVSIAVIAMNICQYGIPKTGPWLQHIMEVIYWIYLPVSFLASSGIFLVLWSTQVFPIHLMTPTWVFPAYPLLLTAPYAGALIESADTAGRGLYINAAAVALGAVTTQGTGCLLAILISAAFIYRLMTQKLPRDFQRPGVFISIGPYAFTVAGMVQLSTLSENIPPPPPLAHPTLIPTLRLLTILPSLWLYGLSLWFFTISVGSLHKYLRRRRAAIPFRMTWWSFVFPNTALVTATFALGKALDSEGLRIFGCVMAALLILVWMWVFGVMLWCLWTRDLLWPKDDA